MKKVFLVLSMALLINLAMPPAPAEAIVVYDPTNYSANIQTSLKQVESVVNEIKMLENQAKNLAKLGQIGELSQLKSTFSQLMKIRSEVTSLLNSYEKFQNEWDF